MFHLLSSAALQHPSTLVFEIPRCAPALCIHREAYTACRVHRVLPGGSLVVPAGLVPLRRFVPKAWETSAPHQITGCHVGPAVYYMAYVGEMEDGTD